jgi:hypothetical protein
MLVPLRELRHFSVFLDERLDLAADLRHLCRQQQFQLPSGAGGASCAAGWICLLHASRDAVHAIHYRILRVRGTSGPTRLRGDR